MTPGLRDAHRELAIHRNDELVPRDEYLDHMTFRANVRPLFTEVFGPLPGVKDDWRAQGASEEEVVLSTFRYRPGAAMGGVPVNVGWLGGEKTVILEETDRHIIGRDHMGRTMKLIKGVATLPLPLDHPVADMDDWLRVKHHYEFSEERFGKDWEATVRGHVEAGRVINAGMPGGFDQPRQLMGEEGACLAFLTRPELIHDILDTIATTAVRLYERVLDVATIDKLNVHEDMAGRTGPLAGPAQFDEFIIPYYRRVWDLLEAHGARLFDVDSDGDINAIIPSFIAGGINVIHPVEPAANMDMVAIREKYGDQLAIVGGIDKHALRHGEDAILKELEYRIPPMVRTGGCVLGLDHRIPNGVSIQSYRFYIKKAWEIIEREAAGL